MRASNSCRLRRFLWGLVSGPFLATILLAILVGLGLPQIGNWPCFCQPKNRWQHEDGLVAVTDELIKFGFYWWHYGLASWRC